MLKLLPLLLCLLYFNFSFSQNQLSGWYHDIFEAALNPKAVRKLSVVNIGTIPSCFSDMENLVELQIYGNDVDYALVYLPDEFYSITKLERLHISYTGIGGFRPLIKSLQNLKEIDVDFPVNPEIGALYNLEKLTVLSLPDSIVGNQLQKLTSLRILERAGNHNYFNSNYNPAPDWIYSLENLENIDIYRLPSSFQNWPEIWPNMKKVSTTIPNDTVISQLKNIENLKVEDGSCYATFPDYYTSLTSLKTLEINNLPSDIDLWSLFNSLGHIKNLEVLTIQINYNYSEKVNLEKLNEIKVFYAKDTSFFSSLKKLNLKTSLLIDSAFLSVFENTNVEECHVYSNHAIAPKKVKKIHFHEYYHRRIDGSDSRYKAYSGQNNVEELVIDFKCHGPLDSIPVIEMNNLKKIKITLERVYKIQNLTEQMDRLMRNLSEIKTLENIEIVLKSDAPTGIQLNRDSVNLRYKFENLKSFKLVSRHMPLYISTDFNQFFPKLDTLVATIVSSSKKKTASKRKFHYYTFDGYNYSSNNYNYSGFSWDNHLFEEEVNWIKEFFPNYIKPQKPHTYNMTTGWSEFVDVNNYGEWEEHPQPSQIVPCRSLKQSEKLDLPGYYSGDWSIENIRFDNGFLKEQIIHYGRKGKRTFLWTDNGELKKVITTFKHRKTVFTIDKTGLISNPKNRFSIQR